MVMIRRKSVVLFMQMQTRSLGGRGAFCLVIISRRMMPVQGGHGLQSPLVTTLLFARMLSNFTIEHL